MKPSPSAHQPTAPLSTEARAADEPPHSISISAVPSYTARIHRDPHHLSGAHQAWADSQSEHRTP